MDNKQLLIIVLAIVIAGLIISIGCFYGLNQNKNPVNNTTSNTTNNTTINVTKISNDDTNNNEKVSDSSNQEKIEFNGKTHSQNVQEAKQSRDAGGQWAGATDAQIEQMIAQEERDGGRI